MALSPRDRKAVMILVPVLVIALALFILSSAGKKGSPDSALQPGSGGVPGTVVSPTPQPSPGSSPGEVLVFSGRDPFQNPFPDATTGARTSASPTTAARSSPTSSPRAASSPSQTPSVSPAGSPPPTPTGGSSTTSGGHTVVLVDIFSSGARAQVEVDGTIYTVTQGQTFASTFKLVTINGTCASFLNGDQSFSLCETANK